MENIWVQVKELVAMYGLNILAAAAILVVGKLAASGVRRLLRKIMRKKQMDPTLIGFIGSIFYAGILAFVIIAALSKLGIQTASFVAVLGAAGLAVGLALQGSLSNFASGVLMIIFKPFKGGDYVDAGGATGFIDEISIFTTTIRTLDNKKVIVPNSRIMGDIITNYTARETRRVDLTAGVSYHDDIDKVKGILIRILEEDDRILDEPAPFVGLSEMAESSVNFTVRGWVRTGDYWDVYFDTNEKIKKTFDSEGITIPFPQRDVHMYRE
ncbi:MAG: mechanosensitive ion channel [Candidatus Fermentibacteraceae bacterium]|nr:mechanosensitive ion channel [Candidatus Fermentibacteraceae bacterium]MBN2609424.1 mechanosensitive ion channel [Candidatus Fermentibacteraceae bacterium]